ncbi:BamA/TamA family outer membrane protein [Roseivirga sp. E12]|uniref:translocation and assembly module lipoprotein TamL n=1 Tax=Roseivirga sp. E12 TaxID=2819237 RepID=UPI00351C3EE0
MKSGTRFFLFLLLVHLLYACSGVRHLEDGEKWLYKQQIEGVDKNLEAEINELIPLKPNTRIPIIGPLGAALYEKGEDSFDTAQLNRTKKAAIARIDSKIEERAAAEKSTSKLEAKKKRKIARFDRKIKDGNFRMKTGSPLSIYDSSTVEGIKARINSFLINSKGFRKSNVTTTTTERNRKISLTYQIDTGPRNTIDSLITRTGDPKLTALLEANQSGSFLLKGSYYDRTLLDAERDRIDLLLIENGYFGFNKGYIEFQILEDPTKTDLWVVTIINKPAGQDAHQSYRLDSIIINTNGNDPISGTKDYFGIKYNYGNFNYSPKSIDARLRFEPGQKYNFTDIENTQRQLLNMDMFRFVNSNFDTSIVSGKFIANLYTAPLQKFQLTQELGFNVTEGLPGPLYNASLKNRNIFLGSEILEIGIFAGLDGVSTASAQNQVLRTIQYGANASLTFPRFITPFRSRGLNKITFNPRTRVSLGFNFTDRPEYVRSNLNGGFAYTWQNLKGNKSYSFNLADISLIDTEIDSASGFQQQLDDLLLQGNTLAFSFNRSFVSSSSFNATYNYDYGDPVNPSSYLRFFLESGGTIYDIVGRGLLENNDLENYQFYKVQVDYRRQVPLGINKSVIFRVNGGIADPYGGNNALPYEKYFFAGGSSSNRAWSPRRLGPGSAFPYELDDTGQNVLENGELKPNRTGADSYQFEQPGEVLIEMNAEYRAKISGFLDWAVFIDAGNIWRLREFETPAPGEVVRISQGAKFDVNDFYKELAIGAGIGVRLDFSFLVFRLDVGHKIKDPRFPEGERWQGLFKRPNQTVYNIAVGYAF